MRNPHTDTISKTQSSLKYQWLLFVLVAALIGANLAWDAYEDYRRIDTNERERMQSQVNIIDLNLERQLYSIDRSLHALRNALPALKRDPDARHGLQARMKEFADAQPGVIANLIVDVNGICIASNREELVGLNFRNAERYQVMSRQHDQDMLFISSPFVSPLKNFVFGAGKIMLDNEGKFAGYVLATISPTFFDTLLRSVVYAPDMRAAVIHGSGKVLARLPDPQNLVGVDLSRSPGFFPQHIESGRRTTVQTGQSLATGEYRLTVMQSMNTTNLRVDIPLVVALSREPVHIFGDWRRRINVEAIAFGMLVLFGALAMLLYQRRQLALARATHDAELQRQQAMDELRTNEENLRITLQSIGDAVIVTDAAGVITNMNPAAVKMTAWREKEAIGQPLADVFRIVNAQTRSPVANPAELVMERGAVVGLANHTVLIARDGREYQIADSAAPIWSSKGNITGVVLVFSDVTEQYAHQEAIRKREALLNVLTRHTHLGMVLVTFDHRYIFVNETYGRMLGLGADTMTGRHVSEIWPGMYETHFRANIERAFAGERGTYEFPVRDHADERRTRWCEITLAPPVDTEYGRCVIGLITDISDRKQAADMTAQLAAIVEHTNDAIVLRDRNDKIMSWNAAAERLFGWTAQEAIGRQFRPMLSSTSPSEKRLRFEKALRGEIVPPMEDVRRCKDGNTVVVETTVSPVRNASFEVIGVSCIMRDVSSRKLAEETRNMLASIVEGAHDAIFTRTLDGRITTWNRGAEKMFGYTAAEAIGQSTTFTLAPGETPTFPANSEQLMGGHFVSREMQRITKDGRNISVFASISPIKDASGATVAASVIMHDVTELKRAQAASAALEGQLREAQKMQAIGTLAGGVAHDFNNIIATIGGNAQLAMEDASDNPSATQSIQEIQKACARARDLVNQILSFSRRQPTQMRLISLEPVVRESARLLRATLPKRISLEVQCDADPPKVLADSTLLEQVLLNLCTNAMHAIPEGAGRISIGLESVILGPELASARPALQPLCQRAPGLGACIVVGDSGIGMDASTQSRIFEPFFTTKSASGGTGLGLAVAHGIVEAHHGAIVVQSEPGHGTTFRIYIPAATAHLPPANEDLSGAMPGTGSENVAVLNLLYIEDDQDVASTTARLLTRRSFNVSLFNDPSEALRELQTNARQYDLVLTDYNMPGLSGVDIAREAQASGLKLPVAMISGFVSDELWIAAKSVGVEHLISKVTAADDLAAMLRAMVAGC